MNDAKSVGCVSSPAANQKQRFPMRPALALLIVFAVLTFGLTAPAAIAAGTHCRMEKQCRWKNFKKYCVWVKVCR
jgi:hypothetical protein